MKNEIFKNNIGQKFEKLDEVTVPRKNSKGTYVKWLIKFLDTGTTKWVYRENAIAGKVRDEYSVSVYGVGFLGFYNKDLTYAKKAKQLWRNMMKRCYCEKDKKGYFGHVTVSNRWHCFENFLDDLPSIKNFNLWLNAEETKYNLDKDFYGDGTLYSLEVCQFITEHDNKSAGAKATLKDYKRTKSLV